MKRFYLALLLGLGCAGTLGRVRNPPPHPSRRAARRGQHPSSGRARRRGAPIWKDGKIERKFLAAHNENVAAARSGQAELVFLGDSITQNWHNNRDIWEKYFGAYRPANFGIGWDRTQGALCASGNGEMDVIKPKVVVLLIGTNNIASDPPEGIARGIKRIIETIREKSPATKVLLLGILPRGQKPEKNPAREKIQQVNAIISKLDDGGKAVKYLYFGDKLLEPDGKISSELMPDFLHFKAPGYQIWAEAIEAAAQGTDGQITVRFSVTQRRPVG